MAVICYNGNYLWERGAEWISDSVFGKQCAPWEHSQKKDEENGIQVCRWKCPVLQESCTLGACIAEHMPRTIDRINPSRASSPIFYSSHSKPQRWEMPSEPVGECSLAIKMAYLIIPMVSLPWSRLGISFVYLILTKLCHLLNRLNELLMPCDNCVHLWCWYRCSCTWDASQISLTRTDMLSIVTGSTGHGTCRLAGTLTLAVLMTWGCCLLYVVSMEKV